MFKWSVQKCVNKRVAKTGFDVTLSEAELEICETTVWRIISLSKFLLIKNGLTLSQFKNIAMLEIFRVDWNEVQGVVGIGGDLVGLFGCEIAVNEPDAGTSSHPCFKFRKEILESIILQGCQKISISWCILNHDLWEKIQNLSIWLGLKWSSPISLMELFCLIEEYFHFLLVHIIHFRKVLERFRNVLR